MMDIVPLVVAGPRLEELIQQVIKESKIKKESIDKNLLKKELNSFSKEFNKEISTFGISKEQLSKIELALQKLMGARQKNTEDIKGNIILDFNEVTTRSIIATYDYIKNSFKSQFQNIVKKEKETRQALGRITKKLVKERLEKIIRLLNN